MKKFLSLIIILLLVPVVLAVDFTPSGNMNGRNIYSIFNFTNISSNKILLNGSMVCTASNGLCGSILDLTYISNNLGNWSADKPYYMYLNGSNSNISYINFYAGGNPTLSEGQMGYVVDEGLSIGYPLGTTLQVGSEMYKIVTNLDVVNITEGTAVSIVSATGNREGIVRTNISDHNSSHAFAGLVTSANCTVNQKCVVTVFGDVHGLNTNSLVESMPVYVSSSLGGLTSTQPLPPYHTIRVGTVTVKQLVNGIVVVTSQIVPELQELSDVDGVPLTISGQVLVWNQTSQTWSASYNVNNYISSAGGWTNTSTLTSTTLAVNITGGNLTVVNGNIGVGTSTPLSKLHISGGDFQIGESTMTSTNPSQYIYGYDTAATTTKYGRLFVGSDGTFTLKAEDTYLVLDSASYVQVQKTLNLIANITFNGDAKISRSSAGVLRTNANFVVDGNFSVGTATPTQKLDVNGSGNFSGTNAALYVNGSQVCTIQNGLCIQSLSTAGGWTNTTTLTSTILDVNISGGNLTIYSGRLMIGNVSPNTPLETAGIIRSSRLSGQTQYIQINGGDSSGIYISAVSPSGLAKPLFINNMGDTGAARNIQFQINSSTKMFIGNDSNVGIGTTTPIYLLDVSGTISSLGIRTGQLSLSEVDLNGIIGGENILNVPSLSTGTTISNAQRITSTGNLVNIGSYQGGQMSLTGGGTFANNVDFSTGANPIAMFMADFNGDNILDAAVPSSVANNVSIHIGVGDGSFNNKTDYVVGLSPYGVGGADFNGDGKIDLAVTNYNSNTTTILLNNGSGTFNNSYEYAVGLNPRSVVSGDFNGDGKNDLVVANYNSINISVLIGNGDGSFMSKVDYTTGTNPRAVSLADFNADGKLDIVVANYVSNTVSVFLGNGDGTFKAKLDFATGIQPSGVTVADFNDDGKMDVATSNYNNNSNSVFYGFGNGSLSVKNDYSTTNNSMAITSADYNGDGKIDIASTNYINNSIAVFLNSGNGSFLNRTDYVANLSPFSIFSGDFNGDGKVDIATVSFSRSKLSISLNQPTTIFFANATSGNVGIGNNNPNASLDIKTSAGFTRGIRIGPQTGTGGDGAYIEFTSSSVDGYGAQIGGIRETTGAPTNALVFRTGRNSQTERMRITDNGTIGIGTTSPGAKLQVNGNVLIGSDNSVSTTIYDTSGVTPNFQIESNDANASLLIYRFGTNINSGRIYFLKTRGSTNTNFTAVLSGDKLGEFSFAGSNGSTASEGARISAVVASNNTGSNYTAADLQFSTSPGGSTNPTQRMVITSTGNVGIGTSIPTQMLSVNGTSLFNNQLNISYVNGEKQPFVLLENATVFDDVSVSGTALGPGSAAPTATDWNGSLAQVYCYAGASTTDFSSGVVEMPHMWKEGSTVYPHIHVAKSTAGTGNYTWNLNGIFKNATGGASILYNSNVTIINGAQWDEQIIDFPTTITPTGFVTGSTFKFRITRLQAAATDNYADCVGLDQVSLHYEKDTLGSASIYNKWS